MKNQEIPRKKKEIKVVPARPPAPKTPKEQSLWVHWTHKATGAKRTSSVPSGDAEALQAAVAHGMKFSAGQVSVTDGPEDKKAGPPIAYPVMVELLYEDYEPFGGQNTRSYSQVYFFSTPQEARAALVRFQSLAREKAGKIGEDLFEAQIEYDEGVVYHGPNDRLENCENLLDEQIEARDNGR